MPEQSISMCCPLLNRKKSVIIQLPKEGDLAIVICCLCDLQFSVAAIGLMHDAVMFAGRAAPEAWLAAGLARVRI